MATQSATGWKCWASRAAKTGACSPLKRSGEPASSRGGRECQPLAFLLFGRLHLSAFLKRHPRVSIRALFAGSVLDFFDQSNSFGFGYMLIAFRFDRHQRVRARYSDGVQPVQVRSARLREVALS